MVTDSDKKYSICVYCASGPVDESFLALASEVGTAIGRRGWQLVSGGGNVSMMGAVASPLARRVPGPSASSRRPWCTRKLLTSMPTS